MLRRVKKAQLENRLKYGEFYQKDLEHDYVCKKWRTLSLSIIKYNTRKIRHQF